MYCGDHETNARDEFTMNRLFRPKYRLVLVIEDGEEWNFPDYAMGGLPISKTLAASLAHDGNTLQKEGSVFLYTVVDHIRLMLGQHGW